MVFNHLNEKILEIEIILTRREKVCFSRALKFGDNILTLHWRVNSDNEKERTSYIEICPVRNVIVLFGNKGAEKNMQTIIDHRICLATFSFDVFYVFHDFWVALCVRSILGSDVISSIPTAFADVSMSSPGSYILKEKDNYRAMRGFLFIETYDE